MKSAYFKGETTDEFLQDFSIKDNQGFDLIDLKYNDGYYIAAYGKNIGKSDFFVSTTDVYVNTSPSNLRERITERQDYGYELTDLEYENGYWHSIYATNDLDSKLIVADTEADMKSQLLDLQDLNSSFSLDYQIVDIEYAEGQWVAVANYIAGDATYAISESPSEFIEENELQRNRGLELTNVEYVDGDLIGIYSKELSGESIHSPRIHADIDDFTAEIEEYRDLDYHLVNTEAIEGGWFGIYKQDADFGEPLASSSAISSSSVDII